MRARRRPQQAIVATAHKIARVFYHMLKHREAFRPAQIEIYEQRRREREIKHLQRRANRLGYTLTMAPGQASEPTTTSSDASVA
jgi:transposase